MPLPSPDTTARKTLADGALAMIDACAVATREDAWKREACVRTLIKRMRTTADLAERELGKFEDVT